MTPFRCLAIDSAELTGWAIVSLGEDGLRLHKHGTVRIDGAGVVERSAAELLALARPVDLVAIEDCWISWKTPGAAIALARLTGRWLQTVEQRGHTCALIAPNTWQRGILPGITQASRSAERKAASVALVKSLFGIDASQDECDAISMAVYTCRWATRSLAPQGDSPAQAPRQPRAEENAATRKPRGLERGSVSATVAGPATKPLQQPECKR